MGGLLSGIFSGEITKHCQGALLGFDRLLLLRAPHSGNPGRHGHVLDAPERVPDHD
jgi:hypothetical protein